MQKWEYCLVYSSLWIGDLGKPRLIVYTINGFTPEELDKQAKADKPNTIDEAENLRDEGKESLPLPFHPLPPPPEPKPPIEMHDFVNQLGEQGWELVKIEKEEEFFYQREGPPTLTLWVFKRPKP